MPVDGGDDGQGQFSEGAYAIVQQVERLVEEGVYAPFLLRDALHLAEVAAGTESPSRASQYHGTRAATTRFIECAEEFTPHHH